MNQHHAILKHLTEGRSITPIDALNLYGCFRLAALILNLRKKHEISTVNMHNENGKRFTRYVYVKPLDPLELFPSLVGCR